MEAAEPGAVLNTGRAPGMTGLQKVRHVSKWRRRVGRRATGVSFSVPWSCMLGEKHEAWKAGGRRWSGLSFTKWRSGAVSDALSSADGWLNSLTRRNSSFGLKQRFASGAMTRTSGNGPKPCASVALAIKNYMSGRCGTKSKQAIRSCDEAGQDGALVARHSSGGSKRHGETGDQSLSWLVG